MGEASRREFLGLTAGLAFWPIAERLKPLESLSLSNQQSFVGIHNGHFLDPNILTPYTRIRLPLNSRAWDPPELTAKFSEEDKDPFYFKEERLRRLRNKGHRISMVIEMKDCDSLEHLEEMFNYANERFHFTKGDRIQMGNEHNDQRQYSIESYVEQSNGLYDFIKSTDEGIDVGLTAQAHYGAGEYFQSLMQAYLDQQFFPFDYAPLNYYGRPQDLNAWINIYREIMLRMRQDKRIVISEIGVRIADDPKTEKPSHPGEIIATPSEQASAVWKHLCFAKLAGCSSVVWFNAQDEKIKGSMQRYGLADEFGNRRPALNELLRAQQILDKTEQVKIQYKNGLYVFNLQGDNLEAQVSWKCGETDILGGPVEIKTVKG